MKKETVMKWGKPMALLATIGALLTTTGCATYYVNDKGEVVATENHTRDIGRATRDVLHGVADVADVTIGIIDAAKGNHRHPRPHVHRPAPRRAPIVIVGPTRY